MGRKNKKYSKNIHQQAYEKLVSMQAFGESKREAIRNGTERDKIFSFNTYQTYWKHTKYFIKYINEAHPECTTLRSARKYIQEWLQLREQQNLSAWTLQTEAKALGKLYGIQPGDADYYTPPQRKRSEIKRSRLSVKRDNHFSLTNNDELIRFCRGTGLRRSELSNLKGGDLISRAMIDLRILHLKRLETRSEQQERDLQMFLDTRLFKGEYFIFVRNGKGGRARVSPIIGKDADLIIRRMKNTAKKKKVWSFINSKADVHSYRADYATSIYKQYARPISEIPYDRINRGSGKWYQSDVYTCRNDEAGKKLDRRAMFLCSKALGHNRVSVVADNYLRGL